MLLFVSYSGEFGGAERLLLQFAAGIDRGQALACPEGPLAHAAREEGWTVFPVRRHSLSVRDGPVRACFRLTQHGLEVRRLVRDLQPELVIAWGMRSAIAALIGPALSCPVVFQHNDMLPGPAIAALVRAAARRARSTITLSEAIADDLGLAGPVVVVHPGVDADRYDGLRTPVNPPEVLVLGALVGWKRPELALEAAALARAEHPQLRLRLVGAPLGDGDRALVEALRRRAEKDDLRGAVDFAGAVADSRDELARASCLLHCAEREPFGMAVLEALAAGRPAVVPAAAGPLEIVDRSCGVLYEPGDAAAAARALRELLSDPRHAAAMGAAGRARARQQFAVSRARGRYAAAIRPLLAECRAALSGLELVTVTFNSAHELPGLLRSIRRHLPTVRVVVVDCGSEDETVAIAKEVEGVDVLALDQNVGFGRGCNRAVTEVRAPVTALVNPDVELLDGSLLALADEAMRRDRLLAPLVVSPDGSRQDSVHPLPTSAPDLLRSLLPPGVVPGRIGLPVAPWRASAPRRVGWAVGCAVVARTETLRRLGPFDERIFLYGEDLDLGLRAAQEGIETWFWPAARVLHLRAASTHRAFGGEPFERLARARHEVVSARLGPGRARLDDAAQAVTFCSRMVVKRLLGRGAHRERRQLEALRQARRERP